MRVLTPNQMVAHNLARLRRQQGLTQQQTVDLLAPFLRSAWSVASLSAAERSVDGKRTKEFDADELVALCRTFQRPLAFWFLPAINESTAMAVPGVDQGLTDPELLSVIFGKSGDREALAEDLRQARRAFHQLDQILERLDRNSVGATR